MEWTPKDWRKHAEEFPRFLEPFAKPMGRSERREGAALYIEGLLLPGERKSIEPMAERLGVDSQRLQQLVTDSPWEAEAVWRVIRREFPAHLEPLSAWIVDETGWLKQGEHSVGVGHQYCGAEGKSANCQVNVQIAVTDGEAAIPVAARLYLPEKWTNDPARCQAAGVPLEVKFATKPQIALDLISEALADGVTPAPVLGDAAYGGNGPFREGLREKGLEFFSRWTPGRCWDGPRRSRWNANARSGTCVQTNRNRRPWPNSGPSARTRTGNAARGRPPTDKPGALAWAGWKSTCRELWSEAPTTWRNCGWSSIGPKAPPNRIIITWPTCIVRHRRRGACA